MNDKTQHYIWITDHDNTHDVQVTGKEGNSFLIPKPQKVIPISEELNTRFNEANKSGDDFRQQAMLDTIVQHYGLGKYMKPGSKSFWSLAPRATQQEMVELAHERFVGRGSVEFNPTPTKH